MNPTEIMTIDRANGGELSLSRPAETVLKEASMVATPWAREVERAVLYKIIGPSKHLYIEAWQMLGAMYRVTARVTETRHVQFGDVEGFEAFAELYHMPTGQIIGRAEAMCTSDEENWGVRPKYKEEWVDGKSKRVPDGYRGTPLQQLRSMAQTRACSKVFSNAFKWVARMKGYAGTPAEEMDASLNGSNDQFTPQGGKPARKSAAAPQQTQEGQPQDGQGQQQTTQEPSEGQQHQQDTGARIISDKQSGRMYAIAMKAGLNNKTYGDFIRSFGFAESRVVTVNKYEEMVAALEAHGRGEGQ